MGPGSRTELAGPVDRGLGGLLNSRTGQVNGESLQHKAHEPDAWPQPALPTSSVAESGRLKPFASALRRRSSARRSGGGPRRDRISLTLVGPKLSVTRP
jgi:hypothetical protein